MAFQSEAFKKENPFKGSISIRKTAKKSDPLFKFDITPKEETSCKYTLMCEFKKLKLSSEEKKELTVQHRERLYYFQKYSEENLQEFCEDFTAKMNHKFGMGSTKLTIRASGFGAYICLAAILSGQLSENINAEFVLSDVPLKLFPSKMAKKRKPGKGVTITLKQETESWLTPFKTLTNCPKFLINSVAGDESYFAKAA